VRTRVTGKAWFGPKRLGWGISPRSWEGWIATALCMAGFAVSLSLWRNTAAAIGCLAILAVVILLTTDPPGGSWRRS
jgi:CDP-diglyceride synthetase